MLRLPAVAGRFYPSEPGVLSSMVAGFLASSESSKKPRRVLGVVVPHAGYIYSGAVAGAVYSQIQLPSHPGRSIILCPNHTGLGKPLAIRRDGAWRTPLGDLQIDTEMCDRLMQTDTDLEDDAAAHKLEHALEVQLPFLQSLFGADHRFVPIVVGTGDFGALSALGEAIAETIRKVDDSTLIIASSDMNHYESDAVTRVKDAKAIDQILRRDPRGLWETVRKERISMCGVGPATATLIAANLLQAQKAELVDYATSAKTSGDCERVVGYAVILAGSADEGECQEDFGVTVRHFHAGGMQENSQG